MAKGGKKNPAPRPTSPPPEAPPPAPAPPAPRLTPASTATLRPLVLDLRLLWWTLGTATLLAFLWLVRDALVSLLIAAVLTFVGAPIVAWLERHRWPRWAGALAFVLGAVLALVGLVSMVVPALVRDFSSLVEQLPDLFHKTAVWAERTLGVTLPTRFTDLSDEASREVLGFLRGGVSSSAAGVLRGAASAASVALDAVLVPVLAYFALADLPRAKKVVAQMSPRNLRPVFAYYVPLIEVTLGKLVRGQLVVALILVVLYMVGLSISGIPLALAISVIGGAAYFVPFASGIVTFALAAAFAVIELGTGSLWHLVGALITCVVVMSLEAYFLTPRIVGEQAGLSPLAAIVAVVLGAAAAGLIGALFALPVGAVVALILREHARRGAPLASSSEAPA